ncbi:MAG: hypothetical protein LR015_06810 [Verrucomicrobia bacterium]|nr:hypothetical protein [Verrucomicrobiota bacterium]
MNYDWPSAILEPDCTGPYDRPFSNLMADTRGYRVHLGADGYLYGAFEAAGGNHIMSRAAGWDPNNDNLLIPAPIVGGDMFHNFFNTRSEHKTAVVRYDPDTGEHILGQQFVTRFWSGTSYDGNGWRIRDGEIAVDGQGNLLMVGFAASGMPIEGFQGYTPNAQEATFNPWAHDPDVYTGGAYLIIMDPTLSTRLFTTRLSGGDATTVAVDMRSELTQPTVVWGGSVGSFRVDGQGGGGCRRPGCTLSILCNHNRGMPTNQPEVFFAVSSYVRTAGTEVPDERRIFLLNEDKLDEIRTLVEVPGTTHFEAYNAMKARVDANQIAGDSSYERGYMAREAAFYVFTDWQHGLCATGLQSTAGNLYHQLACRTGSTGCR